MTGDRLYELDSTDFDFDQNFLENLGDSRDSWKDIGIM
jgi:hypothetical protein